MPSLLMRRALKKDARCAAPHPGEDGGLRICIDIPGLNRAASQELFWPSGVGHCEGPSHSYVRMPFGLPSMEAAFQRNLPSVLAAQEARHHAVLAEMETVLEEPPGPQSLPRLKAPVAREEQPLRHASSATPTSLRQRNQVTFSKFIQLGAPPGCIIPRQHGPVPAACILLRL